MVSFYNFISTNISQLCCLEIKKVNSAILFVEKCLWWIPKVHRTGIFVENTGT
jgi:hypothetical protein